MKNNPLAIASFCVGLISVALLGFGMIPGVVAIILGIIALKSQPKSKNNKIFSIVGIVTGSLAFILPLFFILFFTASHQEFTEEIQALEATQIEEILISDESE